MGAEASQSTDASMPPDQPPRWRRLGLAALALTSALTLDLLTKAWAWERLQDRPGIVFKKGVFLFDFAFNTGSAFGMLADAQWARTFFIVVTLVAVAYLVRLALTLPTQWWSPFLGIGLIAGGALGNLHDRIFRVKAFKTYLAQIRFSELIENASALPEALSTHRQYIDVERHGVIDFIVVYYWPHRRWPAFNVADVALCIGVGLFMIYLHRHGARDEEAEEA